MSILYKVQVLLDEYASGERPQNEVADDILLLIDTAYDEGYEEGNINGYSDAMCEVRDKKERVLKLIGELYA